MRVLIFGTQREEEQQIREMLQVPAIEEVVFAEGILTLENMEQVKGFELVWIITNSIIGEKEAQALHAYGVRYLVTRSAGTDHVDRTALKVAGVKAANVPEYSPGAISEHTILLLLSLLRKIKRSQRMTDQGDFTLNGICGREISSLTVGIVGCGRIGSRTIELLAGFGCKLLVSAPHERAGLKDRAAFVKLEELLEKSDAVLLHCPLKEDNYHMINEESLRLIKKNAFLVNTARGGLVDAGAVLEALKTGKLAGFAFDVYEKEDLFVRRNYRGRGYEDPLFWELCDRDDVIYTAHTGFYTENAVDTLRRITIENVLEFAATGSCKNQFV